MSFAAWEADKKSAAAPAAVVATAEGKRDFFFLEIWIT